MEPTKPNLTPFDDPGLKAAVRRAWGAQQAPETLRASVMAMRSAAATAELPTQSPPAVLGTIRPTPTNTAPSFWHQPWLRYGFAAAATMVIGFGIASRLDRTRDATSGFGPEVTFTSTVPQLVAHDLLESHDRCSKYPDHNAFTDLTRDDFATMRQRLEKRLGFPVLAGNVEEALGRNGWRFKGAAVCKVGDVDAAHLVFVRDGQAISIFSLPRNTCRSTGTDPRECEDANPDHPIAVFVWSDGVHCVVGSSTDRSLSVDQVRSVLEHLRPTLPAPAPR